MKYYDITFKGEKGEWSQTGVDPLNALITFLEGTPGTYTVKDTFTGKVQRFQVKLEITELDGVQ